MIISELYGGQGLGNQLWSYVVTRTLALDRGFAFGIQNPAKFKGKDFMDLDFGEEVSGGRGPEGGPPLSLPRGISNYYVENDTWYPKYKCDIRDYDPGLLRIPDNTKIEGLFQSEHFVLHRRNEIRRWLRVRDTCTCYDFSHDNICVLNIRGGEYKGNPDLLLRKKYWTDAVSNMLLVNPDFEFVVVTDDVRYSRTLLPQYRAFHFSPGKDYSILNNAKYLILSNSSFGFFPAWTSETVKYVIAPKFWARHNISDGFWACAFNLYRNWLWQDRNGSLFTYEECQTEYATYKRDNRLDQLTHKPNAAPPPLMQQVARRILQTGSKAKRKALGLWPERLG